MEFLPHGRYGKTDSRGNGAARRRRNGTARAWGRVAVLASAAALVSLALPSGTSVADSAGPGGNPSGFAATVVALISTMLVLGRYTKDAKYDKEHFLPAHEAIQNGMASLAFIAVAADVLGLVCWVILAAAARAPVAVSSACAAVVFIHAT